MLYLTYIQSFVYLKFKQPESQKLNATALVKNQTSENHWGDLHIINCELELIELTLNGSSVKVDKPPVKTIHSKSWKSSSRLQVVQILLLNSSRKQPASFPVQL